MLKLSTFSESFKVGDYAKCLLLIIPNIQFILKVHFKVISCSGRSSNIESSIRLERLLVVDFA